jgi:hypothetical protein
VQKKARLELKVFRISPHIPYRNDKNILAIESIIDAKASDCLEADI